LRFNAPFGKRRSWLKLTPSIKKEGLLEVNSPLRKRGAGGDLNRYSSGNFIIYSLAKTYLNPPQSPFYYKGRFRACF